MKRTYKKRWVTPRLVEAVEFSPVIVLTGARQTGKSTLLQNEAPFKNWHYLTLDDLDVREMAAKAPDELAQLYDRVVIDEVQKAPELLPAIKLAVDKDRERRFVLSGCAHLLLMKAVSETLAGRALYFELFPFTLGEQAERPPSSWLLDKDIENARLQIPGGGAETITGSHLFRGSLPTVTFLTKPQHVAAWWDGYVRTYLERDLRDLSNVSNLPDFRKIMSLLSSRTGQILNTADIARSTMVSQATAGRYINLLETSGLFAKLQPFSRNVSKRVVKSPKIFCLDTGLACNLSQITSPDAISSEFRGQLFETLVFHNISVLASAAATRIYYLRKQGGLEREIDFVIESGGASIAVEAKASKRVGLKDAENLFHLKDMFQSWRGGFIIYNGAEIKRLRKDIWAIPLSVL